MLVMGNVGFTDKGWSIKYTLIIHHPLQFWLVEPTRAVLDLIFSPMVHTKVMFVNCNAVLKQY